MTIQNIGSNEITDLKAYFEGRGQCEEVKIEVPVFQPIATGQSKQLQINLDFESKERKPINSTELSLCQLIITPNQDIENNVNETFKFLYYNETSTLSREVLRFTFLDQDGRIRLAFSHLPFVLSQNSSETEKDLALTFIHFDQSGMHPVQYLTAVGRIGNTFSLMVSPRNANLGSSQIIDQDSVFLAFQELKRLASRLDLDSIPDTQGIVVNAIGSSSLPAFQFAQRYSFNILATVVDSFLWKPKKQLNDRLHTSLISQHLRSFSDRHETLFVEDLLETEMFLNLESSQEMKSITLENLDFLESLRSESIKLFFSPETTSSNRLTDPRFIEFLQQIIDIHRNQTLSPRSFSLQSQTTTFPHLQRLSSHPFRL